jgi:hypothetical protein
VLDDKNPTNEKGIRKHRFHSLLNEEKGLPAIRAQIWQIIGLLRSSQSKLQYERAFARFIGSSYQTDLFEDE